MKILVLGSGAGGGFPQWNCNCALCLGQRRGTTHARPRTQSSIAVSDDGREWVLLNASPDIGQQLRNQPALHPQRALRDTPIRAVVLMDAQIDHVTGLLSLREGPPIALHCTRCVHEDLHHGLPILPTLEHYCGVRWHELAVNDASTSAEFAIDALPGLRFRAMAIAGKAPPYSPHRHAPVVGDNIALQVVDTRSGECLFYAPGLASVDAATLGAMREASCLMIDGTFWTEREMIDAGLGVHCASDMGHLPLADDGERAGLMRVLDALPARRKLLIHINNSNPILDERSDERRELARRGIEVAHDGMEIEL
jgi:pyrroloquinoline quinone biosynthesis protein B